MTAGVFMWFRGCRTTSRFVHRRRTKEVAKPPPPLPPLHPSAMHAPEDEDGDVNVAISNEEWAEWFLADVRKCAAYAEYASLLEECCAIAAKWRARFWGNRTLWARIRRGRRLAKELAEVVPVMARVRRQVQAHQGPALTILDLCSGFGYLGMFLSELLPSNKVQRIVLVDRMWAPNNVERQPHHINPEHLHGVQWPIRLTTSRADLKVPSDRRALARAFFSHGSPGMLLGVHLCGTLSLRCVELFNDCACIGFLALKPCCLPELLFAHRGDVFGASNGHCFPAKAVCAAGKWNRGKWVCGAGRPELESKYECWVDQLSRCVQCDDDEPVTHEAASDRGVSVEVHMVQPRWFLNRFIFASRTWSPAPPLSSAPAAGTSPTQATSNIVTPNQSNSSGVTPARRDELLAELAEQKRAAKRGRRLQRKLGAECDGETTPTATREAAHVRLTIEPIGRALVLVRVSVCCRLY